MTLTLTVISPVVNIRRGPSESAGVIVKANTGDQFDVVQVLDKGTVEQWARIVLPEQENVMAYACIKLPNGKALCNIGNTAPAPNADEYKRGKREALEHLRALIESELEKI